MVELLDLAATIYLKYGISKEAASPDLFVQ
jgi:hypothetical protein